MYKCSSTVMLQKKLLGAWGGKIQDITKQRKIKAYSSIQVAAKHVESLNKKVMPVISRMTNCIYIYYIFKYGVLAQNPSFLTKLLGGLSLPKHQTIRPPFAESHPRRSSPADAPWVAPHAVHWRAESLNHDDEWPKRLAETEADVDLSDDAWKMGSQDGRKLT